jgi:hypothetical protein
LSLQIEHDRKQRILIFNEDKLNRLAANYSITDKIEIIIPQREQSRQQEEIEAITDSNNLGDTYDTCDTSTEDTCASGIVDDNKESGHSITFTENSQETEYNNEDITNEIQYAEPVGSNNVSQASHVSQNVKSNSNNNTRDIINTSDTLHVPQKPRIITNFQPIILLEDFYNIHESLDQPLPPHSLEQSPCYQIIEIKNNYKMPLYYCKLHPHVKSAYLETIEHHCKYKDPDKHKAEILQRLLKEK